MLILYNLWIALEDNLTLNSTNYVDRNLRIFDTTFPRKSLSPSLLLLIIKVVCECPLISIDLLLHFSSSSRKSKPPSLTTHQVQPKHLWTARALLNDYIWLIPPLLEWLFFEKAILWMDTLLFKVRLKYVCSPIRMLRTSVDRQYLQSTKYFFALSISISP